MISENRVLSILLMWIVVIGGIVILSEMKGPLVDGELVLPFQGVQLGRTPSSELISIPHTYFSLFHFAYTTYFLAMITSYLIDFILDKVLTMLPASAQKTLTSIDSTVDSGTFIFFKDLLLTRRLFLLASAPLFIFSVLLLIIIETN